MSEHKIPGASKGPNYRIDQHRGGKIAGLYNDHTPSHFFQTRTGRIRLVAPDGSFWSSCRGKEIEEDAHSNRRGW
jgi:hypothetical protein